MKVTVGRYAGFCFGVQNALEMTKTAASNASVCTLGELIHNREVVQALAEAGIQAVDRPEDVRTQKAVIRSHGVGPEVYRRLSAQGVQLVDATCPHVARLHELARKASLAGVSIVIIGEADHPEIAATKCWAGERAFVVDSEQDIEVLPPMQNAVVLGQTTYSLEKRDMLIKRLEERIPGLVVHDFICPATRNRQLEAEALARENDAVLVVGDSRSANTRKLLAAAQRFCPQVYLVADWQDIPPNVLASQKVAVTAGASAPEQSVARIVTYLQNHSV